MSQALLDGPPEARAAAIAALVASHAAPNAAELDALRDCLGDQRKLVQRRAAEAFEALAGRGIEIEGLLQAALQAPDVRLRWGAAYALSRIGRLPLEALPTLVDVMGLEDGDLRWAASELLKQLAAGARPRVVASLLATAQTPGAQRKMALYCLRDLDVAEASEIAREALSDPHLETRLAALALLAKVHPDPSKAAPLIAALIDDADPRMQRAAAATLGNLAVRTDEVVAVLQRAASSSDPSLRRAAERSLRVLTGR
jgi:HEAT repeat protein